MRDHFEDRGYQVTTAEKFADGQKILQEKRFDAIVSDNNIPGGLGEDLYAGLRARGDETKFIIVSGLNLQRDTTGKDAQGRQDSNFLFLMKPQTGERIEHALKNMAPKERTATAGVPRRGGGLAFQIA
jgi:DNA-binding NtrC family response regulator